MQPPQPVFMPWSSDAPKARAGSSRLCIAAATRGREAPSDLPVLDATTVSVGQIATAAVHYCVPNGFFGSWIDERELV
ncbi:carotenoid oxygenase family protein [Caballeronia sp. LZ029]|nr:MULTISPECIES: carotenoid oxygenase family protein [unclassified Caballeronia]MCE4547297.1 carotenoid oxygenase family protein [Caballeronia sp. PC1]MCE4575280.1 carotenoid oxygenase family protein [Caballeronia sp. CLC5]MDR5749025.1 carotenoid oxygenase family protein [Caballeronia sp. LZ029]